MSSAKITLFGFLSWDDTLFNGLDMPEQIDKDILIETILMRGGEYEVIYADPDFLKQAITSWSKQWKPTFTEWCRALDDLQVVAPLENYDRIENWSDSTSNSENESQSNSETSSLSSSEENSNSESSQGSSSTSGSDSSQGSESMSEQSGVSAYDSSNFSPSENGSKTASTTTSGTTYTTQGNTQNMSRSGNARGVENRNASALENRNKSFSQLFTHGGRIHGNIGVLTSAKMYSEWIATVQDYGNLYDRIATVFLQSFVIPIL